MSELCITCGDPAGIGPEIVLKALSEPINQHHSILLIMPEHVLREAEQLTGIQLNIRGLSQRPQSVGAPGEIRRWFPQTGGSMVDYPAGQVSRTAGHIARKALEAGEQLARLTAGRVLVTAPVNKEALHLAGYQYPGQTEFLAAQDNAQAQMIMVHPRITTLLTTIHLPLAQVAKTLSAQMILRALIDYHAFLNRYRSEGSIQVLALNPHASDNGLFGNEESSLILPAIEQARRRGIRVDGPLPADTAFQDLADPDGRHYLALYHDQGMIPFKIIAGWEGVNLTWGLSYTRTSPDHGTAFEIAGKGIARAESMIAASRLALELAE